MIPANDENLERGGYDIDLGSGHLTPPGSPPVEDESSYHYSNEKSSPTFDPDNKHTTTVEDVTGTRRWRKFRYVEPAFIFFMIAFFSITPLKNQLVYSRLLWEAINTVHEVYPLNEHKYDSISHRLDYGRSVREELLPPGFFNFSYADKERILSRMNQMEERMNESKVAEQESHFHPEHFWDHIKEESSQIVLFLDLIAGLFAMIMNPIICAYTDVAGRCFGMAVPAIGMTLELVVYLIVTYLRLPVTYLTLGHVFEGLCGSHPAMIGVAYAYIADTATPKKRTFRFVALNAVFLMSLTIGTLTVGMVIDILGYTSALWMITVFFSLSLLYTIIFLEESIEDCSMQFSVKKVFQSTKDAFSIYAIKRSDNGQKKLAVLVLISLLQAMLLLGISDLIVLYLVGPPFSFSSLKIGAFLSEFAMTNALGPLIAIGVFRSQVKDVSLAMFAASLSAVGFIVFAFTPPGNFIYFVPFLLCMSSVFAPLTRAMMSTIVTENEQGQLQATISFLDSIGILGAAPLHLSIFSATLAFFPGLVFLVLAGLMLFILALLLYIYKLSTTTGERTPLKPENEEE